MDLKLEKKTQQKNNIPKKKEVLYIAGGTRKNKWFSLFVKRYVNFLWTIYNQIWIVIKLEDSPQRRSKLARLSQGCM